jgi:hypothetical protein
MQVLKLGANEASAQGLQKQYRTSAVLNFLTKLWVFENRQFVWRIYEARLHTSRKIQYKSFTGTYLSE